MTARRALEWIGASKAWLVFRCEISLATGRRIVSLSEGKGPTPSTSC